MRIRSESWIEVCQWVGSQSQDNRGYIRQGLVIYACKLGESQSQLGVQWRVAANVSVVFLLRLMWLGLAPNRLIAVQDFSCSRFEFSPEKPGAFMHM